MGCEVCPRGPSVRCEASSATTLPTPWSITGDAFDRVATHLVAVLRENGVNEDTVERIADSLGPRRPLIVTA